MKGIDDLPTIDPNLRENLIIRLQTEGLEALQNELQKIDPDYYNQVDLKNSKRVLKALEVYYMTGKAYSVLRTEQVKPRPFKIIQIGLKMERAELYQRIDQRVDDMIKAGLVD